MKYVLLAGVLLSQFAHAQLVYPAAKKITQIETRFGAVIEDPYKWMENASDPDLWSWIEEQKELTANSLDAVLHDSFTARVVAYRKIKEEQTKLTDPKAPNISAIPLPSDEMERRQSVIKWQSSYNLKSNVFQKESAKFKAEAKQVGGGDLTRVVVSKKDDNSLVDVLIVKFYTFVTWADDDSFYYVSDLDERIGGGKPGLFKHTVGDIQSEDKLLLKGKGSTSSITVHQVGDSFYAEVDNKIGSLQLATGKVSNVYPIDGQIVEVNDAPENTATILSFKNANNGELHKLRLRDGERSPFLKEQNFVISRTKRLDNKKTFIIGLSDGSHVAGIHEDSEVKMLDLNNGTIDFSLKENVFKLGLDTYTQPRRVFNYDIASGELKQLANQNFPIEVEAEKIYYTAANGQQASMWVMRKKGVALSAKSPTILYGYGGFSASITPAFGMYESLPWMEKGGVFVVVTLPGSNDYGVSWYEAARVGNRTVAWDSFALAGKELIKRGWTSSDHLGMLGASNGGTLVAGALQRHSDVFKAAVPLVGVMDLINFTLFSAGKYWTNDYGNPFVESDFRAMYPLSPYHNLEKRNYPATMVMTAEFDDRVAPMHSYKYLARLQEYHTSNAPILLYNKEWGGHARASGSERESSRYVGAYYTFFAQQLGLP